MGKFTQPLGDLNIHMKKLNPSLETSCQFYIMVQSDQSQLWSNDCSSTSITNSR